MDDGRRTMDDIEIRSTKSEIRNNIEFSKSKCSKRLSPYCDSVLSIGAFDFRICYEFRSSDFGFPPPSSFVFCAFVALWLKERGDMK
ncbi:MAG: hypothetical protein A2Z25_23335 [Planctomycetes bacterium RBG_16_55_9]|nr:MAG: hypothetical protein A2Z25_23335 [Planctomycetes bacterium RBG_16_55_9]